MNSDLETFAKNLRKITGADYEVSDNTVICPNQMKTEVMVGWTRLNNRLGFHNEELELREDEKNLDGMSGWLRMVPEAITEERMKKVAEIAAKEDERRNRVARAQARLEQLTGIEFTYVNSIGALVADDILTKTMATTQFSEGSEPLTTEEKLKGAALYQLIKKKVLTEATQGVFNDSEKINDPHIEHMYGVMAIYDVNPHKLRVARIDDDQISKIVNRSNWGYSLN